MSESEQLSERPETKKKKKNKKKTKAAKQTINPEAEKEKANSLIKETNLLWIAIPLNTRTL